jgi:cytochrome c551/c552
MKLVFVFVAAAATALGAAGSAQAADAPALLDKYKCSLCHGDTEAKAGPAYVDIAAAYRGKPKAEASVVAIIKKGAHGSGPWRMPPHPEVSAADATTMARYILSRKR